MAVEYVKWSTTYYILYIYIYYIHLDEIRRSAFQRQIYLSKKKKSRRAADPQCSAQHTIKIGITHNTNNVFKPRLI